MLPARKRLLLASLLLLPAVPVASSAQEKARPLTPEQAREENAYTIGVQAYVYGFPLVEMYRVRHNRVFDPAARQRGALNQFTHARRLLDHTYKLVILPNNDTLYSSAWLDLTPEPVVLHVPDTGGRYFVFQLMDFATNNFASVGQRTPKMKNGDFAIVGPGWKGTLPDGLRRIDAPTNAVWLLGRTLVDGPKDLPRVRALQDQYTLTPLSAWGKNEKPEAPKPPAPPPYDLSDPLNFFVLLNAGLRENPPPAREAALMGLFGQIGVGPDRTFKADALDPATRKGLLRAVAAGRQIIAATPPGTTLAGGWRLPRRDIGHYGDDYLFRAVIAARALAALSADEAVYLTTSTDAEGKPLNGAHRYVLHFDKGQEPPAEAFWSLTMYRLPERLFVANPLLRYAVGDRSAELRRGADGSLDIYLQHDWPGEEREANWLPAPRGDFQLALRLYVPKKDLYDGTWKPPAVKRVE